MNKELDTKAVMQAVVNEVDKLDEGKSYRDKSLHFAVSHYLCLNSKPFSGQPIDTSICIIKAVIDSFRIALKKEFEDSGKDFTRTNVLFDKILEDLKEVYDDYVESELTTDKHETDLLADLMGIGTFVINQSMRNLNWKLYEYENNK